MFKKYLSLSDFETGKTLKMAIHDVTKVLSFPYGSRHKTPPIKRAQFDFFVENQLFEDKNISYSRISFRDATCHVTRSANFEFRDSSNQSKFYFQI